jgi:NACalpha-BTF3-like transcription factor
LQSFLFNHLSLFEFQTKIMEYLYDLRTQEIRNVECPFCKKDAVKAIYYPPVLQMKKSRSAAAGTKTKFYHTKERWEIISDCSNCGKSKEEIIKALKEKKIDLKKKLEELRKQGLPTVITTEIRH